MIKKLLASLFVGAALSSVFFVGSVSAQTTQAQIDALLQQIAALQAQLLALQNNQGTQTTAPWCHTFNTNLGMGDNSNEVYHLGYALARDGIPGFEKYVILDGSTPYTETIASGVSAFQDKYRSEILTPNGLAFPTGFVGRATRAKLNQLYGCNNEAIVAPNITYPLGGENFSIGSTVAVSWKGNAGPISITLKPFCSDTSTDCLWNWSRVIADSATGNYYHNEFVYSWTIGGYAGMPSRVLLLLCNDYGCSNSAPFSIGSATTSDPTRINVVSPNGGESYAVGSRISFRWTARGVGQNPVTQLDILDSRTPGWSARSLFGAVPAQNHARLVSSNGTEHTFEYTFVVPANFNDSLPAQYQNVFGGNYYKAQVTIVTAGQAGTASQTTINDSSDNTFSLVATVLPREEVVLARYSYDRGDFVRYQQGNGAIAWREVLKSPVYTFNFEEYALTPTAYYLRDRSRNVSIEIPAVGGWSRISTNSGATWYNLYYVTKVGGESTNRPPVVNGLSAPSSLAVGQTGTWTVNAYDPEQGQLSYSVTWGDEVANTSAAGAAASVPPVSQSSTFTHSYSVPGTYTVRFTVRDAAGLSAQSSATVNVTAGTSVNQATRGALEGMQGDLVKGWAFDPDSTSDKIPVHLYFDGPFGTGKGLATTTETFRSDVNSAQGISGIHGFLASVPAEYHDGRTHTVYAYGIDLTDPTGNILLPGSPKTFTFSLSNVKAGTLSVTKDSSSPVYKIVSAGQSNVTVGVLRLSATEEDIVLKKIALQGSTDVSSITNGISLWDGATKVGSGIFTGSNTVTQINLDGEFRVPGNSEKRLTIKADLAAIGVTQAGVEGGLLKIDYDADAVAGTNGVGASSGVVINPSTTSDTAMDGVRVFRGFPSFQSLSVGSALQNGNERPLMRFSVTANGNDIGIDKFSLGFAQSGLSLSAINVHCYTDPSFTMGCSSLSPDGQMASVDKNIGASAVEIYAENTAGAKSPLQIPAGLKYYFEVRGTVTGYVGGGSLVVNLLGDSVYPNLVKLMGTESEVDGDSNDNFIWSPNGRVISSTGDQDWTNGYGVQGLPSSGLNSILAYAGGSSQTANSYTAIQSALDAIAAQVRLLAR